MGAEEINFVVRGFMLLASRKVVEIPRERQLEDEDRS